MNRGQWISRLNRTKGAKCRNRPLSILAENPWQFANKNAAQYVSDNGKLNVTGTAHGYRNGGGTATAGSAAPRSGAGDNAATVLAPQRLALVGRQRLATLGRQRRINRGNWLPLAPQRLATWRSNWLRSATGSVAMTQRRNGWLRHPQHDWRTWHRNGWRAYRH